MAKEPPANVGNTGSISGLGRFPGEGNGNPLHILAWKIPWTGAWWTTAHGVAKELETTSLLNNNPPQPAVTWGNKDECSREIGHRAFRKRAILRDIFNQYFPNFSSKYL